MVRLWCLALHQAGDKKTSIPAYGKSWHLAPLAAQVVAPQRPQSFFLHLTELHLFPPPHHTTRSRCI